MKIEAKKRLQSDVASEEVPVQRTWEVTLTYKIEDQTHEFKSVQTADSETEAREQAKRDCVEATGSALCEIVHAELLTDVNTQVLASHSHDREARLAAGSLKAFQALVTKLLKSDDSAVVEVASEIQELLKPINKQIKILKEF